MAQERILVASRIPALEYLGYRHFTATLILTLILHILAFYIWYSMPHIKVIDIPVRALNIRLGSGDVHIDEDESPPQPMSGNTKQVESAMTKLIRQPEKTSRKPSQPHAAKEVETQAKTPLADKMPEISDSMSPRQFVRSPSADEADKTLGLALGNSTDANADIQDKYLNTISLWIKKFQLYPDHVKEQGIEGSATIRIRIDRRGNIRFSRIESSTGNEELDQAARDMVRRANPVPALPENYPEGDMKEFLIPVNFNIKDR